LGGALVIAFLLRFASTYSTVLVPSSGGTYTEGMAGAPSTVNPVLCQFNAVDRDLSALIFRGLTRITGQQQIVPDLATGWKVSEDGRAYTFTLDASARWQDGAPVTADDVVYTIGVMQDSAFPGLPYLSDLWRAVEVQRVDTQTVAFQLKMAYAPFLDYTAIGLLPSHLLGAVKSADLARHPFNTAPVGTGRFAMESLDADQAVLRCVTPDNGKKPLYDHLVIRFYSDSAAVVSALERGEVDGVSPVPLANLPEVMSLPSVKLYVATQPELTWVIFNTGDSILASQGVRRALRLATDRQKLIDSALQGQAEPVYGPILPESWAFSPVVEGPATDPANAKAGLEGAGWKAGPDGARTKDGVPLQITLTYPDDSTMQAVATEIARQWGEVGVRVQLEPATLAMLASERLRPRTFQAVLYRWIEIPPDPDPYPFWHSTQTTDEGQNFSRLTSRKIDEMLEEARLTSNMARRKELYAAFQQILVDEVPGVFLYRPMFAMAVSERVKDVQIGPLAAPADRFASFWSWYVTERRVIAADATQAK
jgi:peptide/nickel transport system substrate-binding protein